MNEQMLLKTIQKLSQELNDSTVNRIVTTVELESARDEIQGLQEQIQQLREELQQLRDKESLL